MSKKEKEVRIPSFTNKYTGEEVSTYPTLAFAMKVSTKEKKEDEKSKVKKEKFLGTCPYCKSPMSFSGGNFVYCGNDKCKGVPQKTKQKESSEEKEERIFKPYFRQLTPGYADYGLKLFNI